jgi:amino acid permease
MFFDYTKIIQFESAKSLEDSLQRLSQITHTSYWKVYLSGNIPDSFMMGVVRKDKVILCRVRPRIQNSITPHFYGKFKEIDNKVYLHGKFTMHTFIKIFLTVYITLVFVFFFFGLFIIINSSDPFFEILWLSGCILTLALIGIWKKYSYRNIEWISKEIKAALN